MKASRIELSLVVFLLIAAPALAQNAVQLPTFSQFGVRTTVSVPDRGSVYTGGINRAATGRNEFGTPLLPFRNRSIGSQRSAASVWTSVYIHDFQAMDEALLNQARGSSYRAPVERSLTTSRVPAGSRQTVSSGRGWTLPAASQPTTGPMSRSVAQLKAEHARGQQTKVAEAERLFERGKNAEADGKTNVARIYYQQASRRAEGPLKDLVLARLQLLSSQAIAQR